jgi:hypothetical protein
LRIGFFCVQHRADVVGRPEEASRFSKYSTDNHSSVKEDGVMNLRDHMALHPGQYTLAESHRPLTVEMLSEGMLREEVAIYSVGQDAGGGSKSHLYVRKTVHIATLCESAESSQSDTPHNHDSMSEAVERTSGTVQWGGKPIA